MWDTFSDTTKYCIYGVIVLIIIVIIVWLFSGSIEEPYIEWVKVPPESIGHITGFQWDIDPNFQLYRPWTGKQSGVGEYLGIVNIKSGQFLHLCVNTKIAYYEYDVYTYPSFDLIYSIPVIHSLSLSSKDRGVYLGSKKYSLVPGSYFIALRTAESLNRQAKCGIKYIKTLPSLNSKDGKDNKDNKDVDIQLIRDENRYDQVKILYEQLKPQLVNKGLTFKKAFTSQSKGLYPIVTYVHCEDLTFHVSAGQRLLLIYSQRDAISSLEMHINNYIHYPEKQGNNSVHYDIQEFTADADIHIKEFIYGIHPDSEILPLYAYIYE